MIELSVISPGRHLGHAVPITCSFTSYAFPFLFCTFLLLHLVITFSISSEYTSFPFSKSWSVLCGLSLLSFCMNTLFFKGMILRSDLGFEEVRNSSQSVLGVVWHSGEVVALHLLLGPWVVRRPAPRGCHGRHTPLEESHGRRHDPHRIRHSGYQAHLEQQNTKLTYFTSFFLLSR